MPPSRINGLLLICLMGLTVGCSATVQTPAQLQSRLTAAALITDDWHRDQALASIAADAARAQQPSICIQAVDQINGDSLRDMAVAKASGILNTVSGRVDAELLAMRIGSDSARDQILSLLAKIPPPVTPAKRRASPLLVSLLETFTILPFRPDHFLMRLPSLLTAT